MGGVDCMDQNVSQYNISIRGKKWYSYVVSYCIDLAVQNAWQLHKLHTEKPMDLLSFRRHIATYYLQNFNAAPTPERKGGKPSNYIPRYNSAVHYLLPQEKQGRTRFRTVPFSVRSRAHFKAHDSIRFVPKILVQYCQISIRFLQTQYAGAKARRTWRTDQCRRKTVLSVYHNRTLYLYIKTGR